MRFFFASSTPFRLASGTSPALPMPTPTWPPPPPTAWTAVELVAVMALLGVCAAVGDVGHGLSFIGLLVAADLAGLAGLPADLLAGIANALALVGLRLAGRPDAGRDLADELLVDAHDGEVGRILDLEADPRRRGELGLGAVGEV